MVSFSAVDLQELHGGPRQMTRGPPEHELFSPGVPDLGGGVAQLDWKLHNPPA